MEKCAVCGRTENEVRLFDGVYINELSKICERCSLASGIPIIKRPSTSQLKDSEKPYTVRSRLMRMNHLQTETKKEKPILQQIKELEEKPELEQPSEDELVFNLVDNFHWVLQTARRRKGYSLKQLAEAIKESESAIAMLEKKIVPRDSLNLLITLEQFLGIKLIKKDLTEIERELKKKEQLKKFELEKQEYLQNKEHLKSSSTDSEKTEINPENLIFRKKVAETMSIHELQRASNKIEHDFEYPNKTREEVGGEQSGSYVKAKKGSTPSIYELVKKKEERDKTSVTGKDIEVVDDSKEFKM